MVQACFVFLVLFLTISVNLPHSIIDRVGFDADLLLAALVAVVITGLVIHRQLFLIVLVLFCTIAANLPVAIISTWGVDRDYFFATLIALVLLPIGVKMSGKY